MARLAKVLNAQSGSAAGAGLMFDVRSVVARQKIPDSFAERALDLFKGFPGAAGGTDFLEAQEVTTTFNRFSLESSMFNHIRRYRPGYRDRPPADEVARFRAQYAVDADKDTCDFCSMERTAEDVFGRIRGTHAFTASNVAKYERFHGLLIAHHHSPLEFTRASIADMLVVAHKWFMAAHAIDTDYRFPHIVCDIGSRASASQAHFHCQMSLTRDRYFMRTEQCREAAKRFAKQHRRQYWTEFARYHFELGLAVPVGARGALLSHLCPVKERELIALSEGEPVGDDDSFVDAVVMALTALRDDAGAVAMSLMITFPPIGSDGDYDTDLMPPLMRIVDRGSPSDIRSDVGGMEFFGSNNVGADPYDLMPQLRKRAKEVSRSSLNENSGGVKG